MADLFLLAAHQLKNNRCSKADIKLQILVGFLIVIRGFYKLLVLPILVFGFSVWIFKFDRVIGFAIFKLGFLVLLLNTVGFS